MSKENRYTSRKVREMQAAQRAAERRRRNLIVGGVVVVVIAAVVAVGIGIQQSRDDTGAGSAAPHGVGTGDARYGIVRGDPDAPVTVTLYEDFQCPICKQYEEWLGDTITSYVDAGTIKVDYRPIAILDRMSSTDYSSRAAETAACVLDSSGVDTFVAFHELLFANQPAENTAGLTDSQLADLASQAGADKDTVASCQSDDTFAGWVNAATDAASKHDVTGTPTFQVNGKKIEFPIEIDQQVAIQVFSDAVAAAQQ
jgi:protein-disulfide isomerase